MSTVELLDDFEAGELSVEFEGREPWELLEWALDRYGDGLSLSTAFQEGDVALIDMAYRIDPAVRVFSIDTGRLPQETFDLIEALAGSIADAALTATDARLVDAVEVRVRKPDAPIDGSFDTVEAALVRRRP